MVASIDDYRVEDKLKRRRSLTLSCQFLARQRNAACSSPCWARSNEVRSRTRSASRPTKSDVRDCVCCATCEGRRELRCVLGLLSASRRSIADRPNKTISVSANRLDIRRCAWAAPDAAGVAVRKTPHDGQAPRCWNTAPWWPSTDACCGTVGSSTNQLQ